MQRFKIQLETKQSWICETSLENEDAALELQKKLYDIVQEHIKNSEKELSDAIFLCNVIKFEDMETDKFALVDTYGGDDLCRDDVEQLTDEGEAIPEAERASICGIFTLTLECPICGTEIQIDDSEGRYGDIMSDIDNKGKAIVTCDDCGKQFKQTSYKEY